MSPIERDLLLSDAFLSYADALSRGAMPIEDRVDDEDLIPEPVDIVGVLDAAIASPNPAQLIEALAPPSPEYRAMRRAYAEHRAMLETGSPMRASDARKKPERRPIDARATEKRLQQLADKVKAEIGDFGYRVFTDSAPLMELPLAEKAGLGWRGKHTLLLSRSAGSMFFRYAVA